MRIPTMGALPPLQGEGRDSDVCDWKGWGGDGVIMQGKDGSFPHPPPNLPLEGGVALAIRKVIELWGSSLVEIALVFWRTVFSR